MPPNSSFFARVKTPFQRKYGEVVFPAVLSPAMSPCVLAAAVKEEKTWLESLLHRHGAILFRGYDSSSTASDFNDVVEAFGYTELPYVGGAAPRTKVVGRVFTANESPPHRKIPFHHEMAHACIPEHPGKLFFFCEEEAASGGETPILLSYVVYEKMKEKYPDFVKRLEKVGLLYTRIMGEEDDPSSAIGRGWKSTFWTTDKIVAQHRAAKLKMKLEWTENGRVKTIMGPIPAIKCKEMMPTPRKIWFNSMAAAYTAWGDQWNDPKKTVSFGDGDPLPENIIHDCLKIMEEESIDVPWRKGDLLMMDNFAVLHARKPFTPPRRILAALCK
ncbi:2-oxoglutarate and oxygenase superfamily protein [Perilla frutescens var. hirtella]|uniref:2-oxoglutarate and oxygenase superfamily protein n=1 Tax=Perilla frutescens var. hirtella TaxID=608512 RepID=A0AAD4JE19_PERFH|nr:2-oxoglutarate and oxygenase superfamily protein [Perilla frutescens var. hirtella]